MLLEPNVVGKKTDWANYITLADEHECPAMRVLPKGTKPVNVVKHYQADTYSAPVPNAWPEGKDWDAFTTAGANRKELSARVQKFVKTAAVGQLAEDVTDTAGITSELARETTKKMTEMARDMECSICSDQIAKSDDGQTGNQFRGIGAWVVATTATADADVAVDATLLPAAAQVTTTAIASQTEDEFKKMLESQWTATGSTGVKIALLGSKAKKRFGEFQFYIPTSLSTQSTSRVTNRNESDGTLGNTVDRYDSDWGPVDLHMTRWNQNAAFTGGSATYSAYRTYILNAARWEINWHTKPTVTKLDYRGGGYKTAIEAIMMFLCKNPIGEIAWKPAS